MEIYTFAGVAGGRGTLRLKSDHPVALAPGLHRITEEAPDCVIVHTFTVVEMVSKVEQSSGECDALYNVADYSSACDKLTVTVRSSEDNARENSDAFSALSEIGIIGADTAVENAQFFDEWRPNTRYTIGSIRRYNGGLYMCLQAHTSQADWEPGVAVSLWRGIAEPADEHSEEIEEWCVNRDYAAGNLWMYNGITYECLQPHTSLPGWTPDVAVSLWRVKPAE